MGSTRKLRSLASLLLILSGAPPAPAQAPVALSAELRRLEAASSDPKSTGSERRSALAGLARLRALSGDLEAAAAAWSEAAFAESGLRDDEALLSASECLVLLGEFERAEAGVKTVLLTGKEPRSQSRARYLGAQIEALRRGAEGTDALRAFIDEAAYADRRPLTLYTLWRVTGQDSYGRRLKTEHPGSPEALALAPAPSVSLSPSAPWLFMGGREGVAWAFSAAPPSRPDAAPLSDTAPGAQQSSDTAGPRALQIGLFRGESNARALAKRLADAGFAPEIQSRPDGNAGAFWSVLVSPGKNLSETILALKDSGFEAFPVFN